MLVAGAQGLELAAVVANNGDSEALDDILKLAKNVDDPPLIIGWDVSHLQTFFAAVQQVVNNPAQAPAAVPFNLVQPLDLVGLQQTLMHYIRVPGSTQPAPIRTTAIPCTQGDLPQTAVRAAYLCSHPWIIHVARGMPANSLPIAYFYVPASRTNIVVDAMAAPPDGVPGVYVNLWG